MSILKAVQISKSFIHKKNTIPVLDRVSLNIDHGENVIIMGPSGSGKSTFLHILGGLMRPDSGQILFQNKDLGKCTETELAAFRQHQLGMVFQFHYLLNEFTVLENVCLPLQISNLKMKNNNHPQKLLERLGLSNRQSFYPDELSGGEKQRVAIARALVHSPSIVLADEPTGNLDFENSVSVKDLLFQLQEELNMALVVVTHDDIWKEDVDQVFSLPGGSWG